jgi:photosystem II stability/assembly factor-like uncharacterized protein
MRILVYALTLSLASAHTGVALAARWTNVGTGLTGPASGVGSLAIDSSGSTLYAVGSGVFKSADAGMNWKLLGGITGAQVLALDPTSASTIYAGTNRGVFASTDSGESWHSAGLSGTSISQLVIDPLTPSTLYAAYGDRVYKSTNGGASWTGFALGLPSRPGVGVSAIIIDPVTPSSLYAIAGPPGVSPLYKSTDGAETWTVINPDPVVRFLAITPSTLYALSVRLGLSRSTDGGATWTAMGLNQDVAALAVDPTNSNILYASTSAPFGTPPAMYKSTDGGQKWNPLNVNIPLAGSLVLNPANSSVIYAANFASGVFKSADAGTSWSESNTGLRVSGVQVLVSDPADPATIYAGGDGGLFKSVDRGGDWIQQATFLAAGMPPPGLPPLPPGLTPVPASASVRSLLIDFTNSNILYVGTHRTNGCFAPDILLFKSTDGGASWSDNITPQGGFGSGCSADALIGMDPTDPQTIYLRWGDFFDGFGLRKSTDGGATWDFTNLGANQLYALAIDPTNPATLYAGTDSGVVQSTDGGATWNVVGLAKTNVSLLAIDRVQPNVLYAGASGAYTDAAGSIGLFRSTDRGANWTPINDGLEELINHRASINALMVDPHQTDVLYLATTGYGVFKSRDGGASWAPYNDGLTFLDVQALAITSAGDTTVYAGTPGGVFRIAED